MPSLKNFIAIDGELRQSLIRVAVPVAMQNLLMASLSFVDTIMIGQLGAESIAAVGIGNQIFFLFMLLMFGIGSSASVFVSQYRGRGDLASIHKTVMLSLGFGLTGGLLFSSLSILFPTLWVGFFTEDRAVIALGAEYLSLVAVSFTFSAFSIVLSSVLRSLEKAHIPLYASIVALGINTLLNYLLIFGAGPFPALGVRGAALATAFSRGLEMVLIILFIYGGKTEAAVRWRDRRLINADFIKTFLKTGLPVILNEVSWAAGMTMYKVVYGRIGTGAMAAANISETTFQLMFVVFMGTAHACVVIIGKSIGGGHREQSRRYAGQIHRLGLVLSLIIGALTIAVSGLIPLAFNVSDTIRGWAGGLLIINGLFLPVKIYNTHNIIGIFRGGGDTGAAAAIEISSVWLVGVPAAAVTGLLLDFPVTLVFLTLNAEEIVKAVVSTRRLLSGKWMHDLTGNTPPDLNHPA